jgi:hypothetical protein
LRLVTSCFAHRCKAILVPRKALESCSLCSIGLANSAHLCGTHTRIHGLGTRLTQLLNALRKRLELLTGHRTGRRIQSGTRRALDQRSDNQDLQAKHVIYHSMHSTILRKAGTKQVVESQSEASRCRSGIQPVPLASGKPQQLFNGVRSPLRHPPPRPCPRLSGFRSAECCIWPSS